MVRLTPWLLLGWACGWCCCTGLLSCLATAYYLFFLPPAVMKARSLKNYFTFTPVLADTSMKVKPSFLNSSAATLVWTALYYSRSFLLPIINMSASSPLTSLTLSIHLERLWYEFASTYIRIAYLWYRTRSRPHYNLWYTMEWASEIFTVLPYPIVAFVSFYSTRSRFWIRNLRPRSAMILSTQIYLFMTCEVIKNKPVYYWCFAHRLIAK